MVLCCSGFDRCVPSRFQLRVIRAFKSTLEDLEDRRSCQSIQSLQQSMRAAKQLRQQGAKSAGGGMSPDPDNAPCVACHTTSARGRPLTPTQEVAQETDLLVPRSPPDSQSTNNLCCYHHHQQQQFYNSAALSPQHFNTLVSQSLHFNMAVHSSSLEPPTPPLIPEFPKLVQEISI